MRRFQSVIAMLLGVAMSGCQHIAPASQTLGSARDELGQIDLRQSEIVQSGDMMALTALLHPAYAAHLPNGQILDRELILAMARTGAFAREKHRRVQEKMVVEGNTGIVMGVDHLASPPPLATRGERTRRYTNIYVRADGSWKLVVRHFNFLP